MSQKLTGIFPALAIPLDEDGRFAPEVLVDLIEFLLNRGAAGICVGGATSEYVHFDLQERKQIITTTAQAVAGRAPLLSAVGASTLARVLELARHSAEAGCTALMVPMPLFYPYEQRDLEAFCRKVFSSVALPCLLYDLPQFTNNALDIETVQRLLLTAQNLVGLKDSSGETRFLSRLAMAREQSDFSLLVGDDRLIYPGLAAGWDGAVSGIACLCPELLARLYTLFRHGDREAAKQCQAVVDELNDETSKLPFPWGIRVGLGVRGVPTGPLPLPLAPARRQQIAHFRSWLASWLDRQGL